MACKGVQKSQWGFIVLPQPAHFCTLCKCTFLIVHAPKCRSILAAQRRGRRFNLLVEDDTATAFVSPRRRGEELEVVAAASASASPTSVLLLAVKGRRARRSRAHCACNSRTVYIYCALGYGEENHAVVEPHSPKEKR